MEAGRCFQRAGDADASAAAYGRVPAYGYGWATGMALYEQAAALIVAGKHTEGRALLATPFEGPYADQIAVSLAYLKGYSYRATGDTAEARKAFEEAVRSYESLASPLRGEGLEQIVGQARACLHELTEGRGE